MRLIQPNWVGFRNPFSLAAPPAWWLRELSVFDDQLVVLPSQQEPVYRLTRRRRFSAAFGMGEGSKKIRLEDPSPDVRFMTQLDVVPVETIYPTGFGQKHVVEGHGLIQLATNTTVPTFTRVIFDQLRRRDTWAVGGGQKAADLLDEKDRERKAKEHAHARSAVRAALRSAASTYSWKTGRSVGSYSPRRENPLPTGPPTPGPAEHHGSGGTGNGPLTLQ